MNETSCLLPIVVKVTAALRSSFATIVIIADANGFLHPLVKRDGRFGIEFNADSMPKDSR